MKKHLVLKVFIILFAIIILIPGIYITYDRMLDPGAPPWTSPPYTPGQNWEQTADTYLQSHPESNALRNYLVAYSSGNTNQNKNTADAIRDILKNGWTKEYPEVVQALVINQNAIQEIIKGAEQNNCTLSPIAYRFDAPITNYLKVQTLGKLLAVAGKKLESENRPSEALQYYLDGIQFGKDIGQKEQPLITHLISVAVIGIHIQPILHLIDEKKLGEQDYRKIIDHLTRIDREQAGLADMMEFEHRAAYNTFYQYYHDPVIKKSLLSSFPNKDQDNKALKVYMFFNKGHVLSNHVKMYQEMSTAITTKSYQEFVQTDWGNKFRNLDWVHAMASPSYVEPYTRVMTVKAKLRLAQILSAIQLYQIKNQKWPNDLKDLEPDYLTKVPLDPFTDQPFILGKVYSGEPFVYSTGPDFKDDSAQLIYDPTNGTMSTGDIKS